jgi:hypothetical protein
MKSKPTTTADIKIEQVIKLLFPPLDLHTDKNGDKFHIDYSVDTNLEAALMDLEDGHNDAANQKTIRNCTDRIIKVRQLLEAYREIDNEVKYFIADDFEENDVEKIQAQNGQY